MIIGIGSDITDIKRITKVYKKYGEKFVRRILSAEEIASYKKRPHKAAYLAKRFAVKEATAKALGTGMKRGVYWKNIAAINKPSGAPYLLLRKGALARFNQLGANNSHVTISDEGSDAGGYAIAFVILTKE